MASLECSNCHHGIHYHDIPDGTESILFPLSEWERLVVSDLLTCDYTFDADSNYTEFWKCKECGAIMLFRNGSTNVDASYKKVDMNIDFQQVDGESYIIFEDTIWDTITEPEIKGSEISDKFPDIKFKFARINEDYVFVCDKQEFDNSTIVYERIYTNES